MYSVELLGKSVDSSFVNLESNSVSDFSTSLILNDKQRGEKVLSHLLSNLEECSYFRFAIAFVTTSGVACIHQSLRDAVNRGCKGQILVSQYLNFSDPVAIDRLRNFAGVEIRFINEVNFHGKLYYFEFESHSRALLGSSNLTQGALGKNAEVNLKLSFSKFSGLYEEINDQFDEWFQKSEPITDAQLASYAETHKERTTSVERTSIFDPASGQLHVMETQSSNYIEEFKAFIKPNSMQLDALKCLEKVRNEGKKRSLVISATGTGKTVLSALDVQQFGAKRLLFVVHRLNIAKKAMSEFRKVFGDSKTYGLYSGSETMGFDADFVFSTVQTINTERHIKKFNEEAFDYIIIDESHHAGASTYLRILNHFKPKFFLGMTATPERTDGFDIFTLFDHSVAYEIRLNQALENGLLVPFHYFGVSDIVVDGIPIDEKANFNTLVSSDRVDHIIKALKEFGCDNNEPKGLIFCSSRDEARQLSAAFNSRKLPSIALDGTNSEVERENAIQCFESVNANIKINYIFTVDIFNEGIDIPSVNQVVMLRPTESPIVFVQQLGRGLRKFKNKDYLTVIDFIGNYQNNFLVPVALFGDSTFDKDRLLRLMNSGSNLIAGESTISFDRISKEKIFDSISKAKLDGKKALVDDYSLLKFRLGRHPMMLDFFNLELRDPYQFVDVFGSLLALRNKIYFTAHQSLDQIGLLNALAKFVFNGKRAEESFIIKLICSQADPVSYETVQGLVYQDLGYRPSVETINSAIHSLNLLFSNRLSESSQKPIAEIFNYKVIHFAIGKITKGLSLSQLIENQLSKMYLFDAAEFSLLKFKTDFDLDKFSNGFKRESIYSREDVFRILGWNKNPTPLNVGGYQISSDGANCPLFITYQKSESISNTTKYKDQFLDAKTLVCMSKNKRAIDSPDVLAIASQSSNLMRIPIFVKKKKEDLNFYYVGDGTSLPNKFELTRMNPSDAGSPTVVKMLFELDRPVSPMLFKYLTS
jgi:superfamily II DNA or RNA helicase/HKD family nuclease